MRLGLFCGAVLAFVVLAAFSKGPVLVRSEGEARVNVEGENRVNAFNQALHEAIFQALKKEVSLLEEDPATVQAFMGTVQDRWMEFVVKYRVIEATYTPGTEDSGAWHVKVEVYIDSEELQDALKGEGSMIGG